jgi:hypothetical protein
MQADGQTMRLKKPVIKCDEPVFDFGYLPNIVSFEHNFSIRNAGDDTLTIKKVDTSCGCAPAAINKYRIAPGESAEIKITVSLARRNGRQRYLVRVYSNDPETPELVLTTTGTALFGIRANPPRLYFGSVPLNASDTKKLEVVSDTNLSFSITDIVCDSKLVKIEKTEKKIKQKYELSITTIPPLPYGMQRFDITVRTDNSEFPKLNIPVMIRVTGPVYSTPDELVIDRDLNKTTARMLVVQALHKSEENFQIVGVETPDENIKVTIRKASGGGYRITLEDIQVSKELEGTNIKIITDSKSMPELLVPIRLVRKDNL